MPIEEWKFRHLARAQRHTSERVAHNERRADQAVTTLQHTTVSEDRVRQLFKDLRHILWTEEEGDEMLPIYQAWRAGTATNAQKDRLLYLTLKGLFQAPA